MDETLEAMKRTFDHYADLEKVYDKKRNGHTQMFGNKFWRARGAQTAIERVLEDMRVEYDYDEDGHLVYL